jgi:hypothetical protein
MLNILSIIFSILGKVTIVIALSIAVFLLGLFIVVFGMTALCVVAVVIVIQEHLSELKNHESNH